MISNNIKLAASLLAQEEIIGFPTETVYGLAGNAFSEKAIQKIYSTKKRPSFNPLIVHIKGIEDLEKIAVEISAKAYELASRFWPGPLTLILKKQPHISDSITAGKETVAVRIPRHEVALELLSQLNFPLVAPSANPFGSISPTKANHVEEYFKEQIPMVLEGGDCKSGVESTIVGFEEEKIILYRYGAISKEEIEDVVGPVMVFNKDNKSPKAPGMVLKHYAPSTKFILTNNVKEELLKHKGKRIGLLLFKDEIYGAEVDKQIILSSNGSLEEAASRLYNTLHEMDRLHLELIIAERFPDVDLGATINDRLERASYN